MDEPKNEVAKKPENKPTSKGSLLSPVVINGIAVSVTGIWATSFLADILVKSYEPPGAIHVAFMMILGGVFGIQIINGRNDP